MDLKVIAMKIVTAAEENQLTASKEGLHFMLGVMVANDLTNWQAGQIVDVLSNDVTHKQLFDYVETLEEFME